MTTAKDAISMICWYPKETAGNDIQFAIRKGSEDTAIVFSGTNSASDMLYNFKAGFKKYKIGDTDYIFHTGYLECWLSVKELILNKVKEINPSKITIAGHSFGGALAILCFCELVNIYPNVEFQCLTFGSVKTVSIRTAKYIKNNFGDKIIQYRNGTDLIPMLPPILGFSHISKFTQIGEKFNLLKIYKAGSYHRPDSYWETFDNEAKL